jgi:large subunit ribosomal protein L22
MRLIADLIRGKKVTRAQAILGLMPQKAAKPMLKLVNSAVANAKHNHNLTLETLIVKHVSVDGGPVLKRSIPKAHGRATPIRERTCHINLILEALEGVVEKKSEKKVEEKVEKKAEVKEKKPRVKKTKE